MKKQELINKVNESLGSLFTKDDVIKVIEMLDEGGAQDGYTAEQVNTMIEDLVEDIINNVENCDGDDIVREDDITLSLSGMELTIDSVDVNLKPVYNAIRDAHGDFEIAAYSFGSKDSVECP